MNIRTFVVSLACAGLPLAATAGTLIGSTVDVAAYFPDTSSVLNDGGSAIVGAGVEYPIGTFPSYNGSASVDLTGDQIIISGDFGGFDSAPFNGFGITSLSGEHITSAITDVASTLVPLSYSIVGNELFVNFEGIQTSGVETAVIDVTSAPFDSGVPEPSTWALMLIGFGGLGVTVRGTRRQRATA